MISKKKVMIILHTYNWKDNLKVLIQKLFEVFSKNEIRVNRCINF